MKRSFGWSGVEVPVVGQGTWKMGQRPEAEAAALVRGLELGLTHVDTAELYGAAEDVVGQALARWTGQGGRREDLFLVSKVLPDHATYRGTIAACEATLRRLGTDHLDVYLLHWRGPHPLDETLRALEELVRQGKTRYLGVSNFHVEDLEEAEAAIGPGKIVCDQVYYDLEHRVIELRLLPWCQARGIAVVGYSPFGSDAPLSHRSPGGRVLAEIAAARGVSAARVTLAFLTRLEGTFTIPRAARPSHVEDNAAAAALRLTPDEIARLDRAFPPPAADGGLAFV